MHFLGDGASKEWQGEMHIVGCIAKRLETAQPFSGNFQNCLLGSRLFWLHFCVAFGFGLHLTTAASSTARAC